MIKKEKKKLKEEKSWKFKTKPKTSKKKAERLKVGPKGKRSTVVLIIELLNVGVSSC